MLEFMEEEVSDDDQYTYDEQQPRTQRGLVSPQKQAA
jgi:hypothetical protein